MITMDIDISDEKSQLFEPLYLRERLFIVLYGGRGGGKSWEIADYLLFDGIKNVNRNLCCREIQKSIKNSVHKLLTDRINRWNLERFYRVLDTEIRGVNGTTFQYAGLQDHTVDSIKSFEGCNRTWIEEAQTVSRHSLEILVPTVIRTDDCQIIMSLNPALASDAVYADYIIPALNGERDDVTLINVNYTDNENCPPQLRKVAEDMKAANHSKWLHIYKGQPKLIADGAIYKEELERAQEEGRITRVPYDPLLPVHTVWDIGVGDHTSIWFVQVYGKEVRIIDFYQNRNHGIAHYIKLINAKKYEYGIHFAPHDIKVREFTSGVSRLETAKKMGIEFKVVTGVSITDGIDATRNLLDVVWIDEKNCAEGLNCIRNYRNEYSEKLQELKAMPIHDWASHAADALRYVALSTNRMVTKTIPKKLKAPPRRSGWQG